MQLARSVGLLAHASVMAMSSKTDRFLARALGDDVREVVVSRTCDVCELHSLIDDGRGVLEDNSFARSLSHALVTAVT
jgi:hypothetical protein